MPQETGQPQSRVNQLAGFVLKQGRDALKGLSLLTAWPGTVRHGHYLTYQDLRFKKTSTLLDFKA